LRRWGEALLNQLDTDGAEPDTDNDAQVNELRMSTSRDGAGSWVKGRLDSTTFDALTQSIKGLLKPEADEHKTLAQRQADALGEMCEHIPDDAVLPESGGEQPHLTVILNYDDLKRGLRGGSLTSTGCRIGPREIRRIACASEVIAVVLGGKSEPLDVGREQRTATKHQRRVLAARDGGCAHPGCNRPPPWCTAHHIVHWVDGGRTAMDNMVMLCVTHHRMVHNAGWVIRIRDGLPEFIPPKWVDYHQTPRRKPQPHRC
jgi:hypothetical protein